MPGPFFPNLMPARDEPIPVRRRPDNKPASRTGTPLRRRKDKWENGSVISDINSEGSTVVPVTRPMGKSTHGARMPPHPDKGPGGNNRAGQKHKPYPNGPGRNEDFEDYVQADPYMDLPQYRDIPFLPVYESCRLLQQRGASVKFSAATLKEMNPPLPEHIREPVLPVIDRFDSDGQVPSPQEFEIVNKALTFVLQCGAEIEFHPLVPEQQAQHIQCNACPRIFSNQREHQEHRNVGHCVCEHCHQTSFVCRGAYDDHVREHVRRFQRMDGSNYGQPDMGKGRDY